MGYVLGIDTGGTNTDCVILHEEDLSFVCAGKSPTTHADLSEGIRNSIDTMDFSKFREITSVRLSTTLATNAVVEGKGGSVGLVLSGFGDGDTFDYPADIVCRISGKLDIKGNEKVALSEKEIKEALESLSGKVDALAISCYASVRNPAHELLIRKMAEELTDMPVFCAHELSASLGFRERTVTTVFNAGLLQIVRRLIISAKSVLTGKGISAPIAIVRSDGTLMTEKVAMKRPVDMVLSGPAASILGARHLTGLDDAFILDMGGTTTDIAYMHGGTVSLNPEGANIGGWQTHCGSADISTHGIGGDSLIDIDSEGRLEETPEIKVGPRRVVPVCRCSGENDGKIKSSYGITPTDLAHAAGKLDIWDSAKSKEAMQSAARKAGTDYEALLNMATRKVTERIVYAIIQSVADFERKRVDLIGDTASAFLMKKAFVNDAAEFMQARFNIRYPIIAIGGPVRQWLPAAADILHTEVVIPEHFFVANAIGAAVAEYSETADAIIRPVINGSLYSVYLPDRKLDCSTYEEACAAAEKGLSEYVRARMGDNGVFECSVCTEKEDRYTEIFSSGKRTYVETKVRACASTGRTVIR